ncbi:hypothetical protein D9M68_977020 [compost metagenome]
MEQALQLQRQLVLILHVVDVEHPVGLAVSQPRVARAVRRDGRLDEVAVFRLCAQPNAGIKYLLDELAHQKYLPDPATPRATDR